MKPLNMKFFYGFGSFAFGVQAVASTTMYFINMANHNWLTSLSTWLMIVFSCLIGYMFFYLYNQEGKEPDFNIEEVLQEVEKNG